MKTTHSSTEGMRTAPQLGRWWWIPSTVVVLTLLVLLLIPAAIEQRAKSLRDAVTVGEHARTAVNDFEASLASELLLHAGGVSNAATQSAEDKLDDDLTDLHVAMLEMDGGGLARYDSLRMTLSAWRSSINAGNGEATTQGLRLIASAETLDSYLIQFVDSHRARLRAVSRYNLIVPAVLGPIAVIAMVLSMWLARRLHVFASVAERERAEVVRASESRAALLRGVTHDVKNPLGAASGYAQLLEDGIAGPLDEAQSKMVGRIRHLLNISIQTVTDLLELARTDGTLHLEYAMTDLFLVAQEVLDDHRGMAQEHGITLDPIAGAATVLTDPLRVRQILTNLVSNAIKYTPPGGRVRVQIIHTQGEEGTARIGVAVEDTGLGIPREAESKLFDEFFRVRTGAGVPGNGLGLAISRRLGRLLGGDVTYARRDGDGSVFTVWLPYGGSDVPAPSARGA